MARLLYTFAAALCIAGCASSPVALLTLPPVPATNGKPGEGASVMLREVRVPAYLEGFPMVLGRDGNELIVAPKAEWAERLSIGATRVLRDALAQSLGTARVVIPDEGRVPDAELTIEFLALDPQGNSVVLDARWSYSCADGGAGASGRTRLQVPVASATPSAVAQATGEALARLGPIVAAELPCAARDQMATKSARFTDNIPR